MTSKAKTNKPSEPHDAESHKTTNHDEIRTWVEQRGGHPSTVKTTKEHGEPGLLRIDFPGYSGEGTLDPISWDAFFDKFEKEKLAFLYQKETKSGHESRFCKIISR